MRTKRRQPSAASIRIGQADLKLVWDAHSFALPSKGTVYQEIDVETGQHKHIGILLNFDCGAATFMAVKNLAELRKYAADSIALINHVETMFTDGEFEQISGPVREYSLKW